MKLKENPFMSRSVEQTIHFGRDFAGDLKAGGVLGLKGDLGAGKTTFVKGMAEHFGIERSKVQSPTFSIINEYEGTLPLYHFDCYRLGTVQEAVEIGAEEYFYGNGVCVVEWPERIQSILPPKTIWLTFENEGPDIRQINITESG